MAKNEEKANKKNWKKIAGVIGGIAVVATTAVVIVKKMKKGEPVEVKVQAPKSFEKKPYEKHEWLPREEWLRRKQMENK